MKGYGHLWWWCVCVCVCVCGVCVCGMCVWCVCGVCVCVVCVWCVWCVCGVCVCVHVCVCVWCVCGVCMWCVCVHVCVCVCVCAHLVSQTLSEVLEAAHVYVACMYVGVWWCSVYVCTQCGVHPQASHHWPLCTQKPRSLKPFMWRTYKTRHKP